MAKSLKSLGLLALAVPGGWILYSNLAIQHAMMLPDAIPAERAYFSSEQGGILNYYFDRTATGRPLVLIHSVNAAASAYEMRPLFEHYRPSRPVFALDLPGYGFSDRGDKVYSPRLFQSAILDLVETQIKEPCDVIALSLGCEFTALAALARPTLFRSLACISPTGFNPPKGGSGSIRAAEDKNGDQLYALFAFPLWKRPFYDVLVTRRSLEYYLKKSFVGPIATDLVDYGYATGHQPGAANVPFYFISGKLFTPDVRTRVYEIVHTPTLVLYDQDAYTGFEMLPDLLAKNPNWRAVRITPTKGLPQFEQLHQTVEALETFWNKLA